jgi:hypothetical protein
MATDREIYEWILGQIDGCLAGRKCKDGTRKILCSIQDDVERRLKAGVEPAFSEHHAALLQKFSRPADWQNPTAQREAREHQRRELHDIVQRAIGAEKASG